MRPDDLALLSIAAGELPDPFAAEEEALAQKPPESRLSEEKERAAKIGAFRSQRDAMQPAYRAALERGDWEATASIAEKVLEAAKKAAAMVLLFVSLGHSQQTNLPFDVKDAGISENMVYLDERIRALDAETTLDDENTWTKAQIFSSSTQVGNTAQFNSTTTFTLNATSPTVKNAVYANSIIKAVGTFDGDTSPFSLLFSVNISSVANPANGEYIFYWATPFADTNYYVSLTCGGGASFCYCYESSKATTEADMKCLDYNGGYGVPLVGNILAIGKQ